MAVSIIEAYKPIEAKPKQRSPSHLIRSRSNQSLHSVDVNRLPVEIINVIVRHIDDRATLRALMLTNRTFYKCIFPVFYASLDFASYHSFAVFLETLEKHSPSLVELVEHWTTNLRLTNVGISSTLTDLHLARLSYFLPQLRSLHLNWCHKITDKGLRMMMLQHYKKLEVLRLDRCSGIFQNGSLDLATEFMPNLRALSLSHVQHINDDSLLRIVKASPNLAYLNIACCDKITDYAIVSILRDNKNLRYLNARLAMMTRQSIVELTKHTFALEELNLVHLENEYSLALLLEAINKQTNLKRLHLSLDSVITVEDIAALLQNHPSLTEIHLTRCGAVERHAVEHLNKFNWNCKTKQNVLVTLDKETNAQELENDHLQYI